ncbi:class I SAM-dependent methyltransferase [[Mycobacterium] burgundiense]|uniref:Class I SAM-dependent methyltransferase n=1 Tax=[Mycobacterium] burgundiense TaxID=3064286 RepID=A0ABM9LLZ0_9MYCO|nr:class I SAM-dependent methyltransferase [Mycolicibacterium sp. MU0053]CAJ1501263.1 class I SAM-dependent methyltransferase [Mycolicibacterium sp. MU0053]
MTDQDRTRWDERYRERPAPSMESVGPPPAFAHFEDVFPTEGHALDLACGPGVTSVWLARRGLDVWGVDVSTIAIDQARELAARSDVGDRCRFEVVDLDAGLPAGPPTDVIVCQRFRDRRLDQAIIDRLAPGGLLAISWLSAVGAEPGRFRAAPGELTASFATLETIAADERQGEAWMLARKT